MGLCLLERLTFSTCNIPPVNAILINMEHTIQHILKKLGIETFGMEGKVRVITSDAKTGAIENVGAWSKNTIMFSTGRGKQLVLDRLSGVTTYTMVINYGGIGTSTTTPTTADTQLGAEVARTTVATVTIASNVVTFKFFFADANLANGTYYEFGTFIDATATLNSGQIFNHALFGSAHTKATGKDTTVQVDITIT